MYGIIKLSRWQEHIPFTIPLTLLGGLMAYRFGEGVTLDVHLLYILIANSLAISYAFMINDIEDVEDDKHSPERAARNAVATGDISKQNARAVSLFVAGLAAIFFLLAGRAALILGFMILTLAHLYSWKPIRLKAMPVLDLVSHVLMLATLLMVIPYFSYDKGIAFEVWLLVVAVTLISGYGQLYNQVRDYEADRAAQLKNTASLLGKHATQTTSYILVILGALCLIGSIALGAFPIELLGVLILSLPIVHFFGRGQDMRGGEATDVVSKGQVQFLISANITLVTWLIYVIITNPVSP